MYEVIKDSISFFNLVFAISFQDSQVVEDWLKLLCDLVLLDGKSNLTLVVNLVVDVKYLLMINMLKMPNQDLT